MIQLPRELARRFRAVLRQSLMAEGPRGPWPLLLVQAGNEHLTLQAIQGDRAVQYGPPRSRSGETIAFRSDLLAQFEGRPADPVTLETTGPGQAQARWNQSGAFRTIEFETVTSDRVPPFPDAPKQFHPMPDGLLPALAEATQVAPHDNVRYVLSRVLLRGKAGQVVATDGKHLLIQGGFPFPWGEDVLVPRVPAFGLPGLAAAGPVAVGRTSSHVGVQTGAWTFLLAIDATGRYPDVNQVIPRPNPHATRLVVHPDDATYLLAALPKLPGRADEHAPLTLDLASPPCVRAQDEGMGRITEVVLSRSTVSGPPVRTCLHRQYLGRALQLGFAEVEVVNANTPLLCRDTTRTYLWMPLDPGAALASRKGVYRLVTAEGERRPPTLPPAERKSDPMPPVQPNGAGPDKGPAQPMQPERQGIEEIITEVEALRGLLQDVAIRIARVLAALKHQRRQSRAVQAAMQSLRQLQFDR